MTPQVAAPLLRMASTPFPHRRSVEWLSTDTWKLPKSEGLQTTFHQLRKHPANLIAVERELSQPVGPGPEPVRGSKTAKPPPPLEGPVRRIDAALRRKGQVILYGPPGAGKTYHARRAIHELAARSWFARSASQLSPEQRAALEREGAIETCSFHPAYGYEDFLEGYRPQAVDGALVFERRDGIFKKLCERASKRSDKRFFLLIDEFNRGDVPRIFGELLTVLEKDKRDLVVTLPLSGQPFSVPKNVNVVATMNTADRSVALLDAALRRRFGFIELMPDTQVLAGASVMGLPLGKWLEELNQRVLKHAGRDARNLQVGHAYLMQGGAGLSDPARFSEVLRDDVIPLLEEYCYENYQALAEILGSGIVDREGQRIREALFRPGAHPELIQAVLKGFESLTATAEAVQADGSDEAEQDDDDVEAEEDGSS